MALPLVTIVGRPNVGKSTLFNRLAGRRVAIVDAAEGVTRDRVSTEVESGGRRFEVVDTGGIGFVDESRLEEHVEHQIEISLQRAAVVLFLGDVRTGLTDADLQIAARLRRLTQPVLVVVNKCESDQHRHDVGEFFRLGLGEPWGISALHGVGVDELLTALVALLPEGGEDEEPAPTRRLAIVGRRNAGKSTLINALAREERVICSEIPGTTRDAVDVLIDRGEERWLLIDTAGVRRKRALRSSVDYYSQTRSERAIRRADVAVLMFDCTSDISQVDKHLGRYVIDNYKPCVIAASKWDLAAGAGIGDYRRYIDDRLKGLHFAPIAFLSAREGRGLDGLLKVARDLDQQSSLRVSTAELNRALQVAREARLPSSSGRVAKVFYATQVDIRPPTIVVFVNDPALFVGAYDRFLQNRFREMLPYSEIPLKIHFRRRDKVQLDGGTR